jgi:hypothetical protein
MSCNVGTSNSDSYMQITDVTSSDEWMGTESGTQMTLFKVKSGSWRVGQLSRSLGWCVNNTESRIFDNFRQQAAKFSSAEHCVDC